MNFEFSETESGKIIRHFGQPFYEKVLWDSKSYSAKLAMANCWNAESSEAPEMGYVA